MMEINVIHVVNVDLKKPLRCQRHLFIQSPTSRMASDLSSLMSVPLNAVDKLRLTPR